MKQVFAFALIMCFCQLMTAQGKDKAEADQFRFVQNGETASLAGSNVTFGSFNLTVSRGFTTTGGASASLQFQAFSFAPDFSSFTFTNMFGPIPTGAFTGVNTQHLALDIDTATLPSATFFNETCTVVFFPFSETCGTGPLGVIRLEWRENGAQRTIIDLKQTTFSGPVTTRVHQKSDNSTADVQGSLFGMPVSGFTGVTANVGVNHQSTLEITRN